MAVFMKANGCKAIIMELVSFSTIRINKYTKANLKEVDLMG